MPSDRDEDRLRTAAVTGASSGVGAAIAEGLASRGWKVAIGARRVDRLEELANRLRSEGGEVFAHALDVTDPESVDAFCGAAESELGPVDVLVNNAGIAHPGRIGTVEHEALRAVIDTSLTGGIYMTNRVVRTLKERDLGGDILFVSSDAAADSMPLVTSYGAAKAGIEHFARCLRLELEGTKIRVGVIRIGQAASEFTTGWPEEALGELLAEWQRVGVLRDFGFLQGPEVADAVHTMASQPPSLKLDFLEIRALPPEGGMTEEEIASSQASSS